MNTKEILLEVIKEASKGKVFIDQEEWPIAFNTKIYDHEKLIYDAHNDSYLSELVIKDLDQFIHLLNKYLEKEKILKRKTPSIVTNISYNYIKLLISYLFVNATVEDLKNPISYIEKVIAFLEDQTFSSLSRGIDIELSGTLLGNTLSIKSAVQSVTMDTPRKMEFIIKDNLDPNNSFLLPEISYGIVDHHGEKECYIYSIFI